MAFLNARTLADAEVQGNTSFRTWRKAPTQTTAAGIWFDLSMSPGNPAPNYYAAAPLIAKTLAFSTDVGIVHGQSVSPASKRLRRFLAMTVTATAVPLPIWLLDYLLYYPFIDEGTTDVQVMDNTTTLPRWTTGDGVQMMAVVVGGQTGGQSFRVTYTNSAGVSGRETPDVTMNTQATNGTIVTAAPATAGTAGPFLPLQRGDKGVRSIQSVKMNGEDVGLFTIVLVKMLAQASIRGIDAPVEVDYFRERGLLPEIADDAYLNMICCPQGTLASSQIHGAITTVWS